MSPKAYREAASNVITPSKVIGENKFLPVIKTEKVFKNRKIFVII